MAEQTNLVPKRRFKEFQDTRAWEHRRLGDHAIIKGRLGWKSLKQEEYTEDGPSMIAGKHISDGYVDWYKVDHIPQWRYDESPEIMLRNGDVIFSKDGSLGNPALIENLQGLATINSTMMLVRLDKTINSKFFYQVMKSSQFEQLVYLKVSGSSIPHLFQADMNEFGFAAPSVEEQTMIGFFLEKLDHLILLQQHKLKKAKALKSAYLSEMFPEEGEREPKRRFAGFTQAWEQRRLGELCNEFRSGEFIKASNISPLGDYPVYGGNGIRGYTNTYNHDGEFALIGRQGALCGNMQYSCGRAYFTEHAVAVSANNENDTRFLYYLFGIMNLGQYSGQSAQPGLAVGNLVELKTLVPIKAEQSKISVLFSNLDHLITLHQRKLEKLQNIKKAYLNEMFV